MSDSMEHARESIEHAAHRAAHHAEHEPMAVMVAVLVATLAACLAIFEMAENGAQSTYLTRHITVSDTYDFFQAKNARAVMHEAEADLLASLPNANDPAIQRRITESRQEAARLRDDPEKAEGMKQLAGRAKEETVLRDEALHRYHGLELVVGGLQIAIVLASVSIVTALRVLAYAGAGLGAVSLLYGVILLV
jgi:hypothetical protein